MVTRLTISNMAVRALNDPALGNSQYQGAAFKLLSSASDQGHILPQTKAMASGLLLEKRTFVTNLYQRLQVGGYLTKRYWSYQGRPVTEWVLTPSEEDTGVSVKKQYMAVGPSTAKPALPRAFPRNRLRDDLDKESLDMSDNEGSRPKTAKPSYNKYLFDNHWYRLKDLQSPSDSEPGPLREPDTREASVGYEIFKGATYDPDYVEEPKTRNSRPAKAKADFPPLPKDATPDEVRVWRQAKMNANLKVETPADPREGKQPSEYNSGDLALEFAERLSKHGFYGQIEWGPLRRNLAKWRREGTPSEQVMAAMDIFFADPRNTHGDGPALWLRFVRVFPSIQQRAAVRSGTKADPLDDEVGLLGKRPIWMED